MTALHCADMACKHPGASHTELGQCSEKRAFYNERLHGYDQPVIYRTCDCDGFRGPVPLRAITDGPRA